MKAFSMSVKHVFTLPPPPNNLQPIESLVAKLAAKDVTAHF